MQHSGHAARLFGIIKINKKMPIIIRNNQTFLILLHLPQWMNLCLQLQFDLLMTAYACRQDSVTLYITISYV